MIIQRCRCFAHAETSGIHKIRSFQALKDVAALHMQRHLANVHKIRSFQALKDVAALHMQRHLANVHKIRSFQALKDVAALHMQRHLANVYKIRSFQALKDVAAALHMQRPLANVHKIYNLSKHWRMSLVCMDLWQMSTFQQRAGLELCLDRAGVGFSGRGNRIPLAVFARPRPAKPRRGSPPSHTSGPCHSTCGARSPWVSQISNFTNVKIYVNLLIYWLKFRSKIYVN